MVNNSRQQSTSSARRQGANRPSGIRHHGIRHGEKIFTGILILICLEIGVFTRLYIRIFPNNDVGHRRNESMDYDEMLPVQVQGRMGSGIVLSPIRKETTKAGHPPRIVLLLDNTNESGAIDDFIVQPRSRTVPPMGNHIYHFPDPFDFIDEVKKPFYEQCTPMADWQTKFFPTCNVIHELPLADDDESINSSNKSFASKESQVTLINSKGSWRSVWKVSQQFRDHEEDPENIVLKTLKFNRDFDYESFHLQNIDSIAMERLTSSPYIANEYGFCGESVLTEFAPRSGRDMIKNKKLRTWQRVEIAHDLAQALFAMHSIDYPNATNPTMAHNDINIANTIQGEGGRIKFNDFNIGVLMRQKSSSEPCGYPAIFAGPLWRSPEEIRVFNTSTYVDPAKTDVYGLGNVLFQVLTTHQPWTWLEPGGRPSIDNVIEKKLNGSLPFVPPKFHETNKTGVLALYYATMSCFAYDPEIRPSSYQLAYALNVALKWAKEKKLKSRQEIRELFNFQAERLPARRLRLMEASSATDTSSHHRFYHNMKSHNENHIELSNKTKELLVEKQRQKQAAAARQRSIERRKVPKPKVGLVRASQPVTRLRNRDLVVVDNGRMLMTDATIAGETF